jgi:hypothetical protein
LKPGGRLFIFEPILRELHQIPDDYLRYTPYGITQVLSRFGLVAEKFETEGGPFQAISYCWVQALEYFPAEMRGKMEEWYYKQDFFTQARMDNIQTWVSKEAIDLFVYQVNSLPLVV